MVKLVIPFTRGGVSCLTPQQLDAIVTSALKVSYESSNSLSQTDAIALSFSIFDALGAGKACSKLGVGYAEFCGYKKGIHGEYSTIMTIRQAAIGPHNVGPSTENAVVGESEAGRATIDLKGLVSAVNTFRPTLCLPLYAPSCLEDPPAKKSRTAVLRTAKWFESAVADEVLRKIVALPSSLLTTASVSCESMGMCPMVFLDSACQGETIGTRAAASARMAERTNNLASSSSASGACSSRESFIMAEDIPSLLLAGLTGVDLVECNYGVACAKRGQSIDLTPLLQALEGTDIGSCVDFKFVHDLNDNIYQLDMSPFGTSSSNCPCYSCKRHTKAYVYHLLSVQEMNAETLLTIHNVTQLLLMCLAMGKNKRSLPSAECVLRIQNALSFLRVQ